MMLTPMQNSIVKDTLNAARLRSAQIVLAVERFRLARECFARFVGTAGFHPEVLKDPFDGSPSFHN